MEHLGINLLTQTSGFSDQSFAVSRKKKVHQEKSDASKKFSNPKVAHLEKSSLSKRELKKIEETYRGEVTDSGAEFARQIAQSKSLMQTLSNVVFESSANIKFFGEEWTMSPDYFNKKIIHNRLESPMEIMIVGLFQAVLRFCAEKNIQLPQGTGDVLASARRTLQSQLEEYEDMLAMSSGPNPVIQRDVDRAQQNLEAMKSEDDLTASHYAQALREILHSILFPGKSYNILRLGMGIDGAEGSEDSAQVIVENAKKKLKEELAPSINLHLKKILEEMIDVAKDQNLLVSCLSKLSL